MNGKKLAWRIGFLGVTALAIAMELWAAMDDSSNTEPWTHLITQYVPHVLTFAVIVWGGKWAYDHFIDAYRRRGVAVDNLKSDGKNRAFRTLVQGAAVAFLSAAADAGLQALQTAVGDGEVDLGRSASVAGAAAITAGGMAALSYLHRTVLDPAPVPSAIPPDPKS